MQAMHEKRDDETWYCSTPIPFHPLFQTNLYPQVDTLQIVQSRPDIKMKDGVALVIGRCGVVVDDVTGRQGCCARVDSRVLR